jgi:hypothetical protein
MLFFLLSLSVSDGCSLLSIDIQQLFAFLFTFSLSLSFSLPLNTALYQPMKLTIASLFSSSVHCLEASLFFTLSRYLARLIA